MKTLKKTLCLVLAVIMAVGVLVIPAGAAYDDDAKIEHDEAVAVLSGLDILGGYAGSNVFGANDTLTRAQAAKIVAAIDLGAKGAEKLSTTVTPFNDVKGHWAAKYIAYCANKGYISGNPDGSFAPEGKLTGYAFAKMLLCALGYDPNTEGFQNAGAAWEANVESAARRYVDDKDSIDPTVELDAELDDLALGSLLTRDQAAQMAFNAITRADKVRYEGGTTIELPGGIVVKQGATIRKNGTFEKSLGLTEETKGIEDESFGRPVAYQWQLKDGTPVYTKPVKPVAVYTGEAKQEDVDKDLKGYTYAAELKETEDGKEGSTTINAASAVKGLTGAGKTVEVYATDKKIDKVLVINTYAGVVKVTDATATDPRKVTLEKSGKTVAAFETDDYSDGNVVIFNAETTDGSNYTVVEHEAAEVLKGTMTSASSAKKYTINSTQHAASAVKVQGYNLDDTATTLLGVACIYYLDKNGDIVYSTEDTGEETTVSKDYAVIVNATVTEDTSAWPDTSYTAKVQAVLSDGTIGVYDLAVKDGKVTIGGGKKVDGDDGDKVEISLSDGASSVKTAITTTNGPVYAYELNGNTISLTKLPEANGSETASVAAVKKNVTVKRELVIENGIDSGKNLIQNNKTVYVTYKDNKPSIRVGYTSLASNEEMTGATVVVDVTKGDTNTYVAAVVFYGTENFKDEEATDTKDYVYVTDAYEQSKKDDGTALFAMEVYYADGSKGTITVESAKKDKGIYQLMSDGSLKSEKETGTDTAQTVGEIIGSAAKIGTDYHDIGSAKIVDTTGKGATALAKDMKVVLIENDKKAVSLIFIVAE